MVASIKGKLGFLKSIPKFFIDLKAEAKRITWPSKQDFKKSTLAVIVFCLIWITIVFVMDNGFRSLFQDYILKLKL